MTYQVSSRQGTLHRPAPDPWYTSTMHHLLAAAMAYGCDVSGCVYGFATVERRNSHSPLHDAADKSTN